MTGQSSTPSPSTRWIVLRSPPKVPVPGETSLARIQSHCLRMRLARALARMSSVSAAKPMTSSGRLLARRAIWARMSGFSVEAQQWRAAAVFFQLVPGDAFDPPVGDRGGHHRDIDRERGLAGGQHLRRGLDRHQLYPGRGRLLRRTRNQHRLGAERGERGRDRMALLARGMVGDIAHRVDRLARRAAGDQGATSGEPRIALQHPLDRGDDLQRLGHAARTNLAAGEFAGTRPDPHHPASVERGQIGLGRRMRPHHQIHCRGDQHRLVRGEQRRRRQIIGQARGHARDQIGGGRRHDDQIGLARQPDMAHLALIGQRPQIGVDLVFAQRSDR